MIAVLVNTATVIIGSLIGLLCRKGIPERISRAVMLGIGLCTIGIGVMGVIVGENALIMVSSMVLGGIAGTLLNIDGWLNSLGSKIGARFAKNGKGSATVAEGFVTASLLFCMGSMTIVGSLNAGLLGDNELLYTKSLLDLCSSAMLSVSLGIGVLCAAAFVLVFQGALVLLASTLAPVLTPACIAEMTCVGSLLILGLGLNLLHITKIKVADYLPALVFVPLLCWLVDIFAK